MQRPNPSSRERRGRDKQLTPKSHRPSDKDRKRSVKDKNPGMVTK